MNGSIESEASFLADNLRNVIAEFGDVYFDTATKWFSESGRGYLLVKFDNVTSAWDKFTEFVSPNRNTSPVKFIYETDLKGLPHGTSDDVRAYNPETSFVLVVRVYYGRNHIDASVIVTPKYKKASASA